jgi:hypothetical protein
MEPRELPKLPQARMYLRSAQWGFDELLTRQLSGTAVPFYFVGILASLRAVQHTLKSADSMRSDEHKRVIDEWWRATPRSTPELHFIRTCSQPRLLRRCLDSRFGPPARQLETLLTPVGLI